jgi:hypothetical protein
MKRIFAPVVVSLALASASLVSGCSSVASGDSDIDQKLQAIRRSYESCVSTLGADAQPCRMLASGVDQLARGAAEFDSATSTAAAIKAEEAGRRSIMGQ